MADRINALIEEMVSDFLAANSLELYDVEFVKEGGDWFLRVYIDKESVDEYVCIDECEKVSEYLSEKLDETDPIEQNYYLEVSSPGMDRKLISKAHFEKFEGFTVDVNLKEPYEGQNMLQGELLGLEEVENAEGRTETCVAVRVEIDTKAKNRKPGAKVSPKAIEIRELKFPMSQIKEVRLAVIF